MYERIDSDRDVVSSETIPFVIEQHVEDAAVLYGIRTSLVGGARANLERLMRFDLRIDAHLEGLGVSGSHRWLAIDRALARSFASVVFVALACAIEHGSRDRLKALYALAEAEASAERALLGALAWVGASKLRGIVNELLVSSNDYLNFLGVSACAMHRVDPGLTSGRRLEAPNPCVRARAWRAAGELGLQDCRAAAISATADEDPACQFWAAQSAVLLGAKGPVVDFLARTSRLSGPSRSRVFRLAIQAMSVADAHRFLQTMAQDPTAIRDLIGGAGLTGDPKYVTWLIGQMNEPQTTRLAGESFSLITGLDLASLDLVRKQPDNFESGPNDDPDDPNVEMDEDDGLPWPDQAKIQAWWQANAQRFQPGVRYFMGEPVNKENCLRVLKEGFQRQRILAAHYLCLLNPGTVLFNTSAPAWRQQRLLAQMS